MVPLQAASRVHAIPRSIVDATCDAESRDAFPRLRQSDEGLLRKGSSLLEKVRGRSAANVWQENELRPREFCEPAHDRNAFKCLP
jgi:hypothetical protein